MLRTILLVTVVEQGALAALRPMIVYRALGLGATAFDIGLMAACFALVSLVAAVLGGSWADRWSPRRLGLAGSAIMGLACAATLAADSIALLALSFAGFGLGNTLVIVGSQSMLAHAAGQGRHRDGGFGAYMAASSLGQLLGPLLAAYAVTHGAPALGLGGGPTDLAPGIQLVFAASLVASLVVTAVVVRLPAVQRDPGRPPAGASPSPAIVLKTLSVPRMPLAMVSSLVLSATVDVLVIYLPAYGELEGWSVEFVGLILTTRALAAMAARLFTGWFLARFGQRRLLVASMLISAAALAATPFTSAALGAIGLLAVAGFWVGLGVPVTLHWVGRLAPPGTRGTAIGLRLAANRLGHMVLPIIAGGVGGFTGLGSIFWTLGGLLTGTAAALILARRSEDGPKSNGADQVAMSRAPTE